MLKDFLAFLYICVVIYELMTGKVFGPNGGIIRRKDHPLLYWISAAVGIAFSLVCLYGVFHDLYYWAARL
jgi:hypothetical protein